MHRILRNVGEMAEWSIAAVLKTVELKGSGGSNPSLSAEKSCISGLSLYINILNRFPLSTSNSIGQKNSLLKKIGIVIYLKDNYLDFFNRTIEILKSKR